MIHRAPELQNLDKILSRSMIGGFTLKPKTCSLTDNRQALPPREAGNKFCGSLSLTNFYSSRRIFIAMSRRQHTSFTPGLRTFLAKVMTPTVLVGGLLFLILFNFNSISKTTNIIDNHFNGNVGFSKGALAFRFQENAGLDRPALSYAAQDLLSYSEWGSTSSVDGNVQELWNTGHGYEYDANKNQVSSAIGNNANYTAVINGWQLIEVVTLVNDHTVTVTFNFGAQPIS